MVATDGRAIAGDRVSIVPLGVSGTIIEFQGAGGGFLSSGPVRAYYVLMDGTHEVRLFHEDALTPIE